MSSPSLELVDVDGCPSSSALPFNSSLEQADENLNISCLPLELVETILSFLSEPSSQLEASQV